MRIARLCLTMFALGLLFVLGSLPSLVSSTTRPSPNAGLVLYDGSRGGLPDSQGKFGYGPPGTQATQSFSNGVTTFDTTASDTISAGYGYIGATDSITFDRTTGYTVRFTVQIASEQHANNDRAGFSIIALSSDNKGIELGFWKDQIWAQNYDGTTQFTHGESQSFNTTAALTTYDLTIFSGTYTLRSGGTVLLTGSLRDYSSFCSNNPIPYCPYNVPNFLFLGDDTTSAQAKIGFSFASLTTDTPAIPTPTMTATPTMTSTSTLPSTTSIPPSTTTSPTVTPTLPPQTKHLFLPALMKAP